jgi:predicted lipid-binding transport protein (Tim44 family)
MKTRDSADKVTELPRAPAPTARDANRWPMSSGRLDGKGGIPVRAARSLRVAEPRAGAPGTTRRRSFLRGAAGPLIVALVMGVFAFLRGRKGDGFEDYRGLLIALAVIVFMIVSRLGTRAASRQRHRDGGSGG